MGTKLVAIEDGQGTTLKPIQENLGPMGEPIEPFEVVETLASFPRSGIARPKIKADENI